LGLQRAKTNKKIVTYNDKTMDEYGFPLFNISLNVVILFHSRKENNSSYSLSPYQNVFGVNPNTAVPHFFQMGEEFQGDDF
jgi:hypothetical protein